MHNQRKSKNGRPNQRLERYAGSAALHRRGSGVTIGVADLYMETGEAALLRALERQWSDMTERKMYLTGGVGSHHLYEPFGEPYELPADRAYCETCASIASIMWNWRLLLITGEARFAGLMERTLFNAFLSGRSLDGRRFFYDNPLLRRGRPRVFGWHDNERVEWFDVACCPPNLMRLLSSLSHYFVTRDVAGIQVHQYAGLEVETDLEAGRLAFSVRTEYPWDGAVTLTLRAAPDAPVRLSLRIPAWCRRPSLQVNHGAVPVETGDTGYVVIERRWRSDDVVALDLPMPARLTVSSSRVDATRGCVAIERGPLVYCLESFDQPAGTDLLDVALDQAAPIGQTWRPELLGGVMTLSLSGRLVTPDGEPGLHRPLEQAPAAGRPLPMIAIPYYAWDNRGMSQMRVWMPYF